MEEKSYRIHIRQGEFELDVEGDRAFVEAYAEAFLAEEGDLESMPGTGQKRRRRPSAPKKAPRAPLGEVSTDKAALKAFMRGKQLKSNKERYLEYMRFWHSLGAKEVGDRHIGACYLAEGLPMPPTGRQNFGSLRSEGLVKGGSQRGLWALTSAGLEEAVARAKKASGPKARGRKAAKGRPKAAPAARSARQTTRKAAPKASPPAKRRAARKKGAPRKTAAKVVPKAAPSESTTPEGA